jgi:pseudouridine kinase
MDEIPSILIIGAAAIDTKCAAFAEIVPGISIPGQIRISEGGVSRNIAENLSRLGLHARLITAVGDDSSGRRILHQAEESGIDVSHVLVAEGASTGSYISLLDKDGTPYVAMYDMGILSRITPRYIYNRRRLFQKASFVVLDANLPQPTLETVLSLAHRYGIPVCADPTSHLLARRLEPYLSHFHMITPDRGEAQILSRSAIVTRVEAIEAAKKLVTAGVRIAIVTMGEHGVCYATAETSGHVPAIRTEIVDSTGVGDAMTAAVVFGLLNDFSIDEAIRLGASAASLTLQCRETVCPDLSLERLYDNLVI